MEDKQLVGLEGIKSAVQILRDSAGYGVLMFPEDKEERGGCGSDENGEELDAADVIVRERARKRRIDLEEEQETELKKQKALRGKVKGKARKGRDKETKTWC